MWIRMWRMNSKMETEHHASDVQTLINETMGAKPVAELIQHMLLKKERSKNKV